ncbi:hypothetical protein AN639_10865 [Candidatus Epulonipiscium fishelsonii]|uniref:Uncharacterized protein n=1 Tax=Candidatus Epulonipiscium fishelsonii TaxID=77094 RepID=A0ACC8XF08_9FIRM|nr:hypothetical protein AN396_03665 [Epulopiscium sp. SCG-B11WGA-EpuloA1]ONI43233.1 hypothetical protein AN639_10865 [Epulopiscium sp. SCG-B05WGA-EpuloA1]
MNKSLKIGLILLSIGSIFVGCSSDEDVASSSGNEVVEIDFLGWGGIEEKDLIDRIIAEFEVQNPNIDVTFEIPADYGPKLQTRIAGGNAPDVFYLGFPEFKEYHEQGVLLNMDEYITDLDMSDFYETGIEAFSGEDGSIYGMAKDWGTYVFYYNKTLFEEAGVKTPAEYVAEGNWNMNTMLQVAKEIQAASSAEFGVVAEPSRWKAFVGDDWVDENKNVDVTSTQFAEDLQFMADLWLKEGVAPNVEDLTTLGASDRFAQGNAAMYMIGRWMAVKLDTVEGLDWDIVPMPIARENDAYTWVDSVCLSVIKNTEHPEEAMKFIKFYVDEWAQAEMASSGLGIPVRKSVAESEAFLSGMEGINNSAHVAYEASTLPVFDNWSSVWKELDLAFTDVFNGKITAKEGASLAQEAIDQIGE